MTVIFDGKKFAAEEEKKLRVKVRRLKEKGINPKLVALQVGENKASEVFLREKKKAAKRVGVTFEVEKLTSDVSMNRFIEAVERLNKDKKVHGIMVQLPLPKSLEVRNLKLEILGAIAPSKDVDGMRDDSPFIAPVVRGVLSVIKEAGGMFSVAEPLKVVVVGAKGFVGEKICKVLRKMGYKVEGVDIETKNLKLKTKNADILISATGSPNLIKAGMVKVGSMVIDVGSPKGDVSKEACQKASFVSPVPGGVGPVTIACLLENLAEAAASSVS